jgi:C4-dicarboxylate transporter, DctM subunit
VNSGVDMGISFALFLGFLAVGFEVPFAIALPGVVYLLLQGGLSTLGGLGMVTRGSVNSFTLIAVPLFIFLAEVMQGSGVLAARKLGHRSIGRRRHAGIALLDL